MNKRQSKKAFFKSISREEYVCDDCCKELDWSNKYHRQYNACGVTCKLHSVGMSWADFY